jgi:hypothetical protein
VTQDSVQGSIAVPPVSWPADGCFIRRPKEQPSEYHARCATAEAEPWAGQRLRAQVLVKVQIRNAKEVIWEILAVDQHGTAMAQRSTAGNKRAALDAANEWCALKTALY